MFEEHPTLDQLDEDAETFDHLRMLTTKAEQRSTTPVERIHIEFSKRSFVKFISDLPATIPCGNSERSLKRSVFIVSPGECHDQTQLPNPSEAVRLSWNGEPWDLNGTTEMLRNVMFLTENRCLLPDTTGLSRTFV